MLDNLENAGYLESQPRKKDMVRLYLPIDSKGKSLWTQIPSFLKKAWLDPTKQNVAFASEIDTKRQVAKDQGLPYRIVESEQMLEEPPWKKLETTSEEEPNESTAQSINVVNKPA